MRIVSLITGWTYVTCSFFHSYAERSKAYVSLLNITSQMPLTSQTRHPTDEKYLCGQIKYNPRPATHPLML